MASTEIHATRSLTGDQPPIRRVIEKVGMTFKAGTPVEIEVASGAVMEWSKTVAGKLAGFSLPAASNLATTGVAKTTSEYDVPNQPLASGTPVGAKMNDGKIDFEVAVPSTIFLAQVKDGQTPAVTDVGVVYGLDKDSDGHWYVDKTITGANGVLTIVKLRTDYDARAVEVQILAASSQNVV